MEHRRSASAEFPNDNPELHDGALWVVSRPCSPARLLLRAESEPPPAPAEGEFELPDAGDDGVLDIDIDIELFEAPAAVAAPAEFEPVALPAEPDPVQLEAAPETSQLEAALEAPAAGQLEAEPEAPVDEQPAGEPPVDQQPAEDQFAVFLSALVRVAMDAGATRIAAALPAFIEQGLMPSDGLAPGVVQALTARGFAEVRTGGLAISAACAETAQAWRRVLSGESDDLSACGTSTLDAWAAELLAAALDASPDSVKKLRRELRRQGVAAFGIIAQAA